MALAARTARTPRTESPPDSVTTKSKEGSKRLATRKGTLYLSPRTPDQLGPRIRKARMELGLSLAAGPRMRRGDGERARDLMVELLARPQVAAETRARAQLILVEALLKLRDFPAAVEILKAGISASEASRSPARSVELYDRMGTAF